MVQEDPDRLLTELLNEIGVQPHDLEVYRVAMTHSSYLNEQGLPTWEGNERLEFLGDAVVGLVVTEALYKAYPEKREGALSKIKSVLVSRKTLAGAAADLGLGKPLRLGVGESKSGGKRRLSILAAVFESFIGALYLDQGFEKAREFSLRLLHPMIEELAVGDRAQDDKSKLQEWAQQVTGMIPRYRIVKSEGPDHDKWFAVEVSVRNRILGYGEGPSKKSAEQRAARDAASVVAREGEASLHPLEEEKGE